VDKAYIRFTTHAVYITRTEQGTIHCWKVAGSTDNPLCEFEVFQTEKDATEWIVEPFPSGRWQVVLE
jgi:hypothetical protein